MNRLRPAPGKGAPRRRTPARLGLLLLGIVVSTIALSTSMPSCSSSQDTATDTTIAVTAPTTDGARGADVDGAEPTPIVAPTTTTPAPIDTTVFGDRVLPDWTRAGTPRLDPDDSFDVTDYGAVPDDGDSDSAAFAEAVTAAIANGGGRVAIPVGNFLLDQTLQLGTGVVLSGEGPTSRLTLDLDGIDAEGIVAAGSAENQWTAVAADIAVGADTIVVADGAAFSPGDIIEIEQDNDPEAFNTKPEWDVDWGAGSIGEVAEVASVDGATVTLTAPLFSAYGTKWSSKVRTVDAVRWVGLEEFTVVRNDDGYGNTMAFRYASNVWIDGVVSSRTTRAHVALDQVRSCEVTGSTIHGASDFGDGGRAYGLSVARHTTNCLLADNALYDLRHAIIIQLGASGNVVAYNHARGSAGYEDRQPRADLSLHGHWPQANLFEGNILDLVSFSDWWGPAGPTNTLYRSCVLQGVTVEDSSEDQIIAGNVLRGAGLEIFPGIERTLAVANATPEPTDRSAGGGLASADLPPSLWRTGPPDFLGDDWPAVDAADPTATCHLPASERSPLGDS